MNSEEDNFNKEKTDERSKQEDIIIPDNIVWNRVEESGRTFTITCPECEDKASLDIDDLNPEFEKQKEGLIKTDSEIGWKTPKQILVSEIVAFLFGVALVWSLAQIVENFNLLYVVGVGVFYSIILRPGCRLMVSTPLRVFLFKCNNCKKPVYLAGNGKITAMGSIEKK